MRTLDREEIFALFPHDDPEMVAYAAWKCSPFKWTLGDVAAFGAFRNWPGVWSIWMFATDSLRPRHALKIVRTIKPKLDELMRQHNAHRLECKTLSTHKHAHNFIRALGLHYEATHKALGKWGEDFYTYAKLDVDSLLKV